MTSSFVGCFDIVRGFVYQSQCCTFIYHEAHWLKQKNHRCNRLVGSVLKCCSAYIAMHVGREVAVYISDYKHCLCVCVWVGGWVGVVCGCVRTCVGVVCVWVCMCVRVRMRGCGCVEI